MATTKQTSPDTISDLTTEPEDLIDYEDKSKDQIKAAALNELNIDEEELKEEAEQSPTFSKDTKDAMANIDFFSEKLENSLKGKTLIKTGKNEEVYKQTGKAVAGDSFIRAVSGIIKTFAHKSMLIAKKEEKIFYIQFEDAWYKISDMILERKHNVNVIMARTILKEVKDTFWNLGDILLSTGGNMSKWFGALNDNYSESEKKIRSGLGDM